MTTEAAASRLIVVGRGAQSALVQQLRSLGHEVSVVADQREAEILLASERFDVTVLPSSEARTLMQGLSTPAITELEAWRHAALAAGDELKRLLESLRWQFSRVASGLANGTDVARIGEEITAVSRVLHEVLDDLETGENKELNRKLLRLEDVVEAAALTIYPSAADRSQRLAVDIDEDVATVRADRTKLRLILSNLLDHASRDGRPFGSITVHAGGDGDDCVISVTHEGGPGNPPELRSQEPDQGLERVQRIAGLHGGRLWVESRRDGETTVFVSLPHAVTAG